MIKIGVMAGICAILLSGCGTSKTPAGTPTTTATGTSVLTTAQSTTSSTTTPSSTATTTPGTTSQTTPIGLTPVIPSLTFPAPLISNRTVLNATEYIVLAWNDLGMHCANPSYDTAVLLPPYNNIWVQVIKRGTPPQIVTTGLTVEYRIVNNTYSYGKGDYSQFWDNAKKLFGIELVKNTGLNLSSPNLHNGLSGTMEQKADHFEVNGIPVTPINDDLTWNPFQVTQITVKDATGRTVAQTYATVPVSDEIDCAKCHGADPFQNILEKHDKNNGTNLVNQKPVLCAGCHGSPALGSPNAGTNGYLSARIHGFHAGITKPPACYDCHPGEITKCSRSLAHTAADGNCTACHGSLAQVASTTDSGRIPWVSEPKCVTCHPGVAEVDTQNVLYRNATGHSRIYCAGCHSSPHAMIPTTITSDNYQALQYQGAAATIGSCGACHSSSRGKADISEFTEVHGGVSPEIASACMTCHTSVPLDTGRWPHAYQWSATTGTGIADDD